MDPIWEDFIQHGTQDKITLGGNNEKLLKVILKDFAHFTIMMTLYSDQNKPFRLKDITTLVHEPKSVVKNVLAHFMQNGLVRESGTFTKSYKYIANNPWDVAIYSVIKLWKHPDTHSVVLRKILSANPAVGAE